MRTRIFELAAACLLAFPASAQQIAPGATPGVRGVTLSADGLTLASVDKRTIRLWDAARLTFKTSIKTPETPIESVLFSPNGQQLLSISSHTVHVWDPASGRELDSPASSRRADAAAFSPDGRMLATAIKGTLHLYDAGTGQATTLRDDGAEATSMVFSPDGAYLFLGSSDYTVRVWDVRGQRRFVLSR